MIFPMDIAVTVDGRMFRTDQAGTLRCTRCTTAVVYLAEHNAYQLSFLREAMTTHIRVCAKDSFPPFG